MPANRCSHRRWQSFCLKIYNKLDSPHCRGVFLNRFLMPTNNAGNDVHQYIGDEYCQYKKAPV